MIILKSKENKSAVGIYTTDIISITLYFKPGSRYKILILEIILPNGIKCKFNYKLNYKITNQIILNSLKPICEAIIKEDFIGADADEDAECTINEVDLDAIIIKYFDYTIS